MCTGAGVHSRTCDNTVPANEVLSVTQSVLSVKLPTIEKKNGFNFQIWISDKEILITASDYSDYCG